MPSSLEFLQVQTLLEASFSCVISPLEVCHLPKKPLTFCNPLLRAVFGRAWPRLLHLWKLKDTKYLVRATMFLFIYFRFWCICYFCVSVTKIPHRNNGGKIYPEPLFQKIPSLRGCWVLCLWVGEKNRVAIHITSTAKSRGSQEGAGGYSMPQALTSID